MDIDCFLPKVASRYLDEFMRQYVWQIAVGIVSFISFRLNVDNPFHNSSREMTDRMQDFAMQFIIQRLKCIPRIHAKACNKQYNLSIIHIQRSVDDTKLPSN